MGFLSEQCLRTLCPRGSKSVARLHDEGMKGIHVPKSALDDFFPEISRLESPNVGVVGDSEIVTANQKQSVNKYGVSLLALHLESVKVR
jgi:hypothetical protein